MSADALIGCVPPRLADGSRKVLRHASPCALAEIEEYWVMDLEARMVERWLADRGGPSLSAIGSPHPRPAKHPLEIDLERFFSGLRAKLRPPR